MEIVRIISRTAALGALLWLGASCGGAAATSVPAGVGTSGSAADSTTGFDLRITPGDTRWELDGRDRTDRPPVHVRGIAPGRHKITLAGSAGYIGQEIGITVTTGSVVDVDAVLEAKGTTSTLTTTVTGRGAYIVTDSDVEILDIVRFQPGTAVMMPESHPILDAVAATLDGDPGILLVEVQSHTAEPGNAARDLRLSQQRADGVRAYLVAKGVAPARLVAQGYGATQPLDRGHDDAARVKNERIAFLILKRSP